MAKPLDSQPTKPGSVGLSDRDSDRGSDRLVDVLVIGGGIIGLSCARELARRGLTVTVLERAASGAAEPARQATVAAAGMLVPLAEESPHPAFLSACLASLDLWSTWVSELESETGIDLDYDRRGSLLASSSEQDDLWLDRVITVAEEHNQPWTEASPTAVRRQQIPDLAKTLRRVIHLPSERRLDNVAAAEALRLATRGAGVEHYRETTAFAVDSEAGAVTVRATIAGQATIYRSRKVLVATGAWSGAGDHDSTILGLPKLPVTPTRGQMIRLEGIAWPWTGNLFARHRYAVRRGASSLLIGATVENAGYEPRVTDEGLDDLIAWGREWLPGVSFSPKGRRQLNSWAGLRPTTPDGMPILGALECDGSGAERLFVATGHHRAGILLAPWTARVMADLITAESMAPELEIFSSRRFETDGDDPTGPFSATTRFDHATA